MQGLDSSTGYKRYGSIEREESGMMDIITLKVKIDSAIPGVTEKKKILNKCPHCGGKFKENQVWIDWFACENGCNVRYTELKEVAA
jgi:hypothetical protein